jgi:hypothetical protein
MSHRRLSQEQMNEKHDEQIAKHKDMMDKRKKYWFYRSSLNSQLKQHQIKPAEFVKYGDDDMVTSHSYQSPVVEKYPSSMQYCRKARIFDKFAQWINPVETGINFLELKQEKLPYIYKQHSSNVPFQRERNLNSLIKDGHTMNSASLEQKRMPKTSVMSEVKGKKNRNVRELQSLKDNKQKDTLHIHKSFSFKCTSKRETSSNYKFVKWKEPSQHAQRENTFGSFFQA